MFDHPATFSSLTDSSMGGTDSQLLWHGLSLVQMGHRVQVLGATRDDIVEEGVEFVGARDADQQKALIASGHVRQPDVILLEGAFAAAAFFRSAYPKAKIVHVGQNIDPTGHRKALAVRNHVDIYAFVGLGQLASYSERFPQLRHKFMLLRNIVPWHYMYNRIEPQPVTDKIIWVGAWKKKGLRQWAENMQAVLRDFPAYTWTLCGPSYGSGSGGIPDYIFRGLDIPQDRITIKNIPMAQLMAEISSSRFALVSLGNETASISALDTHAMSRPVLSGNDMVYKYTNPDGTGVRIATPQEGYQAIVHLINRPALCDQLGAQGKRLILHDYTEENQKEDLTRIISYLEMRDALGKLASYPAPSRLSESVVDLRDKAKRKLLNALPQRTA